MNDTKLWKSLAFKTRCYGKNFDLIAENDNIVTEYDGNALILRIAEQKIPLIIGEYGFSVWNIELGKMLNTNFNKMIHDYAIEHTYQELLKIVKDNLFDLNDYKKIVFLHSFVLREAYRKHGVLEEYIEFIYREHYNENTAIIALVKPFQNNPINIDYYLNHKTIQILNKTSDTETLEKIPAFEYYSLAELYSKEDDEFNNYKLFAAAYKCGFKRIGESYLFKFSPEIIVNHIINKMKLIKNK